MAIKLGDAVLYLKGDNASLRKSLRGAQDESESTFEKISRASVRVGAAMTTIGAAITGVATASVMSFASLGDELAKAAGRTGLTAQAVGELGYVAERSGATFGDVENSLRRMSRTVDDARQGSERANGVLARLGITSEELAGMTPDDMFIRLGTAIGSVEDPIERAALAQEVFGRSALNLMNVFQLSGHEIDGLRERYRQLMPEMDTDAAEALADAMLDIRTAMKGLTITIGQALTPSVIEGIEKIIGMTAAVSAWVAANPELTETIVKVTAAVGALFSILGPVLMMLPGLAVAFKGVAAAVAAVAGASAAAVAGWAAVVVGIVALIAVIGYLIWNWDSLGEHVEAAWEYVKGATASVLAWFGGAMRYLWDLVVWAFTNPIEAITMAWEGLLNFFANIWNGIVQIFQAGWSAISWIFEMLAGFGNFIGEAVGSGFAGGVPQFADGGVMSRNGLAMVGERGPELVRLPQGARVHSTTESEGMMGGGGLSIGDINIQVVEPRASADDIARVMFEELQRRLGGKGAQVRPARA